MVATMGKARNTTQRSVYVADEPWLELRRMALEAGTTASGINAELLTWFLNDAPEKLRASITAKAAAKD